MSISAKIRKLLEDRGIKHLAFGLGKILDMTPKIQATKENLNKSGFFQIKNISVSKDTIKRVKRQHTNWRKFLPIMCLTRELYLKCIKNSNDPTKKKMNNPI